MLNPKSGTEAVCNYKTQVYPFVTHFHIIIKKFLFFVPCNVEYVSLYMRLDLQNLVIIFKILYYSNYFVGVLIYLQV